MKLGNHLEDLEDMGYAAVVIDDEEQRVHLYPEPSDWSDIDLQFRKTMLDRISICARYLVRTYTTEQGFEQILEEYPQFERV